MRVDSPFSLYLDQAGGLLDAGSIYVGVANGDPEASPIPVYWDSAFTIPAIQPLRTRGGVVVDNGVPSLFFVNAADYSLRVRDSGGNQVDYIKSIGLAATPSQPLDADLTTIAGQANQPFGLSLLTAASAVALKAILGLTNLLFSTGGSVSGNIFRSGAGPFPFHSDPSFTAGDIITTDAGASDPLTADGQIWLELAP